MIDAIKFYSETIQNVKKRKIKNKSCIRIAGFGFWLSFEKKISKKELLKILIVKNVIKEENQLIYNIDYLLKAFCIKSIEDDESNEIFYEITQSGKVIEYLE